MWKITPIREAICSNTNCKSRIRRDDDSRDVMALTKALPSIRSSSQVPSQISCPSSSCTHLSSTHRATLVGCLGQPTHIHTLGTSNISIINLQQCMLTPTNSVIVGTYCCTPFTAGDLACSAEFDRADVAVCGPGRWTVRSVKPR